MKHKLDRLWLVFFWISCLALFSPIIFSEYAGDDITNSTICGTIISGEYASLTSVACEECVNWFRRGRAFVLSPYLCFYVHGVCNQLWYLYAYKIFLAAFSLVNLLLFKYAVKKFTGSIPFSRWTAVCYLALLPLQFQYETAFWTYHGIMQTVMFCAFLSIIFLLSFLDESTPVKKAIDLSCVLLFNALALTIYEPALIIGPILWVVFILRRHRTNIKRVFLISILIALPTIAFLGLTTWARVHATDSYEGVVLSLNPLKMVTTFIYQLSSVVPGLYSFLSILIGKEHLSYFTIGGCLWASMTILVFAVLIRKTSSSETQPKANPTGPDLQRLTLWLLGLAFLLFPCLIMSISKRYQDDLVFSRGWLPTYMSTFGLSMIAALLTYAKSTRRIRIALVLLSAAGALSMQLRLGKPHTPGHLKRAALAAAIRNGSFDVSTENTFYMTDTDASDIDIISCHPGVSKLISALTGRRITILPMPAKHETPETTFKNATRLTFSAKGGSGDYMLIIVNDNR